MSIWKRHWKGQKQLALDLQAYVTKVPLVCDDFKLDTYLIDFDKKGIVVTCFGCCSLCDTSEEIWKTCYKKVCIEQLDWMTKPSETVVQ